MLQHAVGFLESAGDRYDAVCLLQPTNPLRTAELIRVDVERSIRSQRELALFRYRAAMAALGAGPSDEALDKSHAEAEQLFERGLIPVTLFLETHRQRLDLIRGQNESELVALDALSRLRALEGRPFEVQP